MALQDYFTHSEPSQSRKCIMIMAGPGSSVGCVSDWLSGGHGFDSLARSVVKIDHEIFSMVILSLPLIQERQLQVTGKIMCTEYWLTA